MRIKYLGENVYENVLAYFVDNGVGRVGIGRRF